MLLISSTVIVPRAGNVMTTMAIPNSTFCSCYSLNYPRKSLAFASSEEMENTKKSSQLYITITLNVVTYTKAIYSSILYTSQGILFLM